MESTIVANSPQVDGRSYITERHIDQLGRVHDVEYLAAAGADITAILMARSALIDADVKMQLAIDAEASNYKLLISKYKFRRRFTLAERIACDQFNLTFEAHPALTVDQKKLIRTGLEDYNSTQDIDTALTRPLLQMYEAIGLIAPGRSNEIAA